MHLKASDSKSLKLVFSLTVNYVCACYVNFSVIGVIVQSPELPEIRKSNIEDIFFLQLTLTVLNF